MAFEETKQSKIFPNEAFGYWKVVVERPLRLNVDLSLERRRSFRNVCRSAKEEPLANLVDRVGAVLGPGPHQDFNCFMSAVSSDAGAHGIKLTAKRQTLLKTSLALRDETAEPVIKSINQKDTAKPDESHGLYSATINDKPTVVEYEPDPELRDTEQVPLLHEGGIEAFLHDEVLPYAPDAWYVPSSVKVGYEISFNRHFYQPRPMRSLDEIRADILASELQTDGLLAEIMGSATVN